MKSILFSPLMVMAILEERKTQTRRDVNPQPDRGLVIQGVAHLTHGMNPADDGAVWYDTDCVEAGKAFRCPYGVAGDRLWVRETHFRYGHWEAVEGKLTKGGRQKWAFVADTAEVLFEAPKDFRKGRHSKDPATKAWHKRLARFMPRALSRITLEIVSVRVERLQGISEDDALAEGIIEDTDCIVGCHCAGGHHTEVTGTLYFRDRRDDEGSENAVDAYRELWESINGPESWEKNPWVWVVEFRRVDQ